MTALFDEARQGPLAAGNVALVIRTVTEALPRLNVIDRERAYAFLREAARTTGGAITAGARADLGEALDAFHEPAGHLHSEHQASRAAISALTIVEDMVPGGAHVLFRGAGTFDGRPYGAVHSLVILSRPYGEGIRFAFVERRDDPRRTDEPRGAIHQAFWTGAAAALDLLARRVAGDDTDRWAAKLLLAHDLTGDFPTIGIDPRAVDGPSLGLAASVATVSTVLGLPVPASIAFTGTVDLHGHLGAIDGVDVKLVTAAESGMTCVYAPHAARLRPNGVEVRWCRILDEVIDNLWPGGRVADALHRTVSRRPQPVAYTPWSDASPAFGVSRRVLLSMVGKSDPVGVYKDKEGRSSTHEDGPILGACREIRPARVVLFFTKSVSPDNDFTDKAKATREFLEAAWPECRVDAIDLPHVDDPSDLDALWRALREALARTGAAALPDGTTFVNVTSGTGQMMVVWHLLLAFRQLNAIAIQVRESRFVRDGESRVRVVKLPRIE